MALLVRRLAALAAALTLTACTGTTVNNAQVYQPVTGVIQMEITVPTGESFQSVQFLVDDKLIFEDDDGSDGFAAELDTTEMESDSLVKITAKGVHTDKSLVVLRENYILVGKQTAEEATTDAEQTGPTESEASPTPDASSTK